MKNKRALLLILPSLLLPSCEKGILLEGYESIRRQDVAFYDLSREYALEEASIPTYFVGHGSIPYVSPESFFKNLKGLVNGDKYTYLYTGDSLRIAPQNNPSAYCTFDVSSDEISFQDYDAFAGGLLDFASGGVSYSFGARLRYAGYSASAAKEVVLPVGEYGFDLVARGGNVLVPFALMNLIFFSPQYYNAAYNGSAYYGGYTSWTSDLDFSKGEGDAEIKEIYADSPYAKRGYRTGEETDAFYHSLMLQFDYFYGLKEEMGVESYADYARKNNLEKGLLSNDPAEEASALYRFFDQGMNDLHTSMYSGRPSFYQGAASRALTPSEDDHGSKYRAYRDAYLSIRSSREEHKGEADSLPEYEKSGDTAIIRFDSFDGATMEEVYGPNGDEIQLDHYEKDAYLYLYKYLHQADEDPAIKNVVIDLSLNGGGYLAEMYQVIGFLTDDPLTYCYSSTLTGQSTEISYRVDSDFDGDWDDDDSFRNRFSFYLLTSPCSYSAANAMAVLCQRNGYAKTIGVPSGGGTCSVLPGCTSDGFVFQMSSPDVLYSYVGGQKKNFESGCEIDLPFTDYSKYADASAIASLIDAQ